MTDASEAPEREARERLARVRERMERACARAGRAADDVTLVGVSKRQPAERIAASVRAGVAHLGESYVQELRDKRPRVEALVGAEHAARLRWSMVGGLQRNKVRQLLPLVDVVESVDREPLAAELDRRAREAGRVLDVCLQVNLSREPQKSGVAPEELASLLAACAALDRLRVVGLMTVPRASDDPEDSRTAFARLRELRDTLRSAPGGSNLRELSMGMSADFEIAIAEGATRVRIGTALFGPRTDA